MTGEPFFVPLDEPVRVWNRGPIASYDHMVNVAYGFCTSNEITSMMVWDSHWNPIRGPNYYWIYHFGRASSGGYSLPEEGRSYLRWLLKGPLVDKFKE